MSRRSETLAAGYFDALYTADPDPWRFKTSGYERGKYQATLAALDRQRYGAALEVGCAIGVFTRLLSERCEHLLAVDGSAVALEAAKQACADCGGVTFAHGMVPAGFPQGRFDLIVLSEVLYYLARPDLDALAELCLNAVLPGGELVLCHWLGETDYPLSGQEATELFLSRALRRPLKHRQLAAGAYQLDHLRAP